MDKTWEEFWTTGKVTDYLKYRDLASDSTQEPSYKKEHNSDVTDGCTYGHGTDSDAYR